MSIQLGQYEYTVIIRGLCCLTPFIHLTVTGHIRLLLPLHGHIARAHFFFLYGARATQRRPTDPALGRSRTILYAVVEVLAVMAVEMCVVVELSVVVDWCMCVGLRS